MKTAKKILSLVIVMIMCLGTLPMTDMGIEASAEETIPVIESDMITEGYYTYIVVDGTAILQKASEELRGDIVVPEKLGGYTVTGIQAGAFQSNSAITGVTIPGTVKVIGPSAFNGCNALKTVVMQDGVESISYMDEKLTAALQFEYSDGLDSWTMIFLMTYGTFYQCKSLESVIIPDSVTTIGDMAFASCTSLTDITISENITSIGTLVFEGTPWYTSLADGPIYFGSIFYAYKGTAPETVVIKDGTTLISNSAFYTQTGIVSVTIPDSIKLIDDSAFYGCTGLTSITIPDGVTSIGEDSFRGCTGITSVVIPSSVTSIGTRAFYDCTALANVTMSENVTSVGAAAFYNTAWHTSLADGPIYFGDVLYNYKGTGSGVFEIKDGTVAIADSAFVNCTGLTSITIPDTVISIGENAFVDCTGLTSITIPDSVTSIGRNAFRSCKGLTSVTIPENVTNLGFYAFCYCTSLESVEILADITEMVGTFEGCTNLTDITIPDSVTTINNFTFQNCKSLKSITIPDGVTKIGYMIFSGCSALESIVIPEGVTSIDTYAFEYCSGLKDITIPASLTSISGSAFDACTSLEKVYISDIASWCNITFSGYKSNPLYYAGNLYLNDELVTDLTIPETVQKIGSYAFYGCTSLKTANILADIDAIDTYTFTNCTALESVVLPESLYVIGREAFRNCSSLKSVIIPDNTFAIDTQAFYGCSSLAEISVPEDCFPGGGQVFHGTAWYNNQADGPIYINDSFYSYKGDIADKSFTIKDGTTAIAGYAFAYQPNIETVIIPESVIKAGVQVFEGSSLKYITLPDNLMSEFTVDLDGTEIPVYMNAQMFKNCTKLETVVLPKNLEKISEEMFYDCTNLKNCVVPENVNTINYYAFYNCGFTEISLPKTLETVGDSSFYRCANLTDVYYAGNEAEWKKISISRYNDPLLNATIHFAGSECTHKNTTDHAAVSATCTKIGYTAGTYCSDCEEWISGHEEIPATNHKNAVNEVAINASCTANGREAGKYCPDCKTWVSGGKEIPATNHKNAVNEAAIAATCSSVGREAGKYCPDCKIWVSGGKEIPVSSHIDENPYDGYCDFCGAETEAQENCSCNCHKGGIAGFFFKIILFFQRIFRTNKTCDCGVAHY